MKLSQQKNSRHRFVVLLAVLSCPTSANAAEAERGFSYFLGLGRQHLTYKEKPSIVDAKTKVDWSSPLLVTGGVYAVTDNVLLALDTQSTFAANSSEETWRATGSTFDGMALTSDVLQTNEFKLQQNHTRMLGFYRLHKQWFVVTGPAFHSQTFKRYAFTAGPDNATNILANQVVEESSSEILWQLGVALESETLSDAKTHYSVRLYSATPLWSEVETTVLPNETFDATGGYDLAFEGRYSIAVLPDVHLGGWLQYSYSRRDGETNALDNGRRAEKPESTLTGFAYGLEMLWNL